MTTVVSALCYCNGNIWAIQQNTNLLLKIDCELSSVTNCYAIEEEPSYFDRAWPEKLYAVDNKLYIIFYAAKRIYCFDLIRECFLSPIAIPEDIILYHEFVECVKGYLYFFPSWKMPMMKLSCSKRTIQVFRETDITDIYMSRAGDVCEGNAYSVDRFKNIIYKVNLYNGNITKISVGDDNDVFWGIKKNKELVIIFHIKDNKVLICNNDFKILDVINPNEGVGTISGDNIPLDIVCSNDKTVLFPYYHNKIFCIRHNPFSIEMMSLDSNIPIITSSVLINEEVCIFDSIEKELIYLNLRSEKIRKKHLIIEFDTRPSIFKNKGIIIKEKNIYPTLLDLISDIDHDETIFKQEKS